MVGQAVFSLARQSGPNKVSLFVPDPQGHAPSGIGTGEASRGLGGKPLGSHRRGWAGTGRAGARRGGESRLKGHSCPAKGHAMQLPLGCPGSPSLYFVLQSVPGSNLCYSVALFFLF